MAKTIAQLKELEELAVFLADLISKGDKALEDDKITWLEGVDGAWFLIPQVRDAFTGLKNIPDEIKNATLEDLNQLVGRIASRLSIRNAHNKDIALKALHMAIAAVDLINVINEKPQFTQGFGTAAALVLPSPININEADDAVL